MLDGKELLLGAQTEGGGKQRHSQPDLPADLLREEPLARRAKPKAQKCVMDPSGARTTQAHRWNDYTGCLQVCKKMKSNRWGLKKEIKKIWP